MSATKHTTMVRVRRTSAEVVKRIADQCGRSQPDVEAALVEIGAAHPELLAAALAALPSTDRERGEGGTFKKSDG